jgi:hypothetical protein
LASALIDAERRSVLSSLDFIDCGVDGWPAAPALSVESLAATIRLDIHFEDRGVTDEAIDGRKCRGLVGKILPHSPNGWLAVIGMDRHS